MGTKTIGEFCLEKVYDTYYGGRNIQTKLRKDDKVVNFFEKGV